METSTQNLYRIRAAVSEYPEDSWRDIEIESEQTLGDLGAAVLAAFEVSGNANWAIDLDEVRYTYSTAAADSASVSDKRNPDDMRIGETSLTKGSRMLLIYSYFDTVWTIDLTVESIGPVPTSKKRTAYPRVAAGKGARIVESVPMDDMSDLVGYQKRGDSIANHPELEDMLGPTNADWRYDFLRIDRLRRTFKDSYPKILQTAREAGGTRRKPGTAPPKPAIYTFRFESAEFPEAFWREVELRSDATIGDLAGAVLAAFGTEADHLWSVYYKGYRYFHFVKDQDISYYHGKRVLPRYAYDTTLGELGLTERSIIDMMYDYGTTWYFQLRVLDRRPETANDQTSQYPRLVNGQGRSLLSDFPMDVMYEVQQRMDSGASLTEDEWIMGYIGDFFVYDEDADEEDEGEFIWPAFDLEQAALEFPDKAHGVSSAYRMDL